MSNQNHLNDPDLPRKLLLAPAEDLGFYREGDTLQKALYNFVLDEKYPRDSFHGDVLWALNEAFYQCARVFDDPSPEADIYQNYLITVEPSVEFLNSEIPIQHTIISDKGYFVFCLVYIALSVQASLPKSVSIFRNYLRPLISECKYFNDAEACIGDILKYGLLDSDLAPNPCLYCKYYYKDIAVITNDFDVRTIEKLLRRCRTKGYQFALMEMVEKSFFHLHPEARPTSPVSPIPR